MTFSKNLRVLFVISLTKNYKTIFFSRAMLLLLNKIKTDLFLENNYIKFFRINRTLKS